MGTISLQQEIIQELLVAPTIDAKEEIRRSIEFMKDYLTKFSFFDSMVLGISGKHSVEVPCLMLTLASFFIQMHSIRISRNLVKSRFYLAI